MKNDVKKHLAILLCFAVFCAQFPAGASMLSSRGGAPVRTWGKSLSSPRTVRALTHSAPIKAPVPPAPSTGIMRNRHTGQNKANSQSPAASLNGQSSTQLPDGRLLLLGGEGKSGPVNTASVENITTAALSQLPSGMVHARAFQSATVLPNGTVFIFGGLTQGGALEESAEIFDPSTLKFSDLTITGLTARSHQTTTLLTDGRLLIAGGQSSQGNTIGSIEFWDSRSGAVSSSVFQMLIPRKGQSATLQADGSVLFWGGSDQNDDPLNYGEVFDPLTQASRLETAVPQTDEMSPWVEQSIPQDGEQSTSADTLLAVRFSKRLRVQSLSTSSVTLTGPAGPLATNVVAAESGMLLFVTASDPLSPGGEYSLSISGAGDAAGQDLPATTITFTVASSGSGSSTVEGLIGGGLQSGSNSSTAEWKKLPPLQAPAGVTAIAGQVLRLDGTPLKDVTLRIGARTVKSDDTGRFVIAELSAGRDVMVIDGRTASTGAVEYGVYEDGVQATAGTTTALTYTIWMTRLDTAQEVSLPVPTPSEVVVTNPLLPGLEFHIPPGTTIRDIDGNVTHKISITPIPLSQPPFPLPPGVNTEIFFTIQPGGGTLWVDKTGSPDGGWLVYPNSFHQPPKTPFDFWNYDPDQKGWYIYGYGAVSPNGNSVVPNSGTLIYQLTGAMDSSGANAQGSGANAASGCTKWGEILFNDCGGEPVDLATGLFVYDKTDLYLPDIIPIALTRTYRQNDSASRAFGVGATQAYDMFLVGDCCGQAPTTYTYQQLVLPDGGRIDCPRISSGTSWTNAIFQCDTPNTIFDGAKSSWNGSGWNFVLRSGITYQFRDGSYAVRAQQAALIGIVDSNGNTLTVTRDSNYNATQITSPSGRWVQLSYDSNYRVTQAQDNIGRTVQYFYDSGGRLDKVIDAGGGTWLYNYDSNNNMTSLVDPRSIMYLQNQFDSLNRVTVQTLADGVSTFQFSYNPSGNPETDVTDPLGNIKKVQFNPAPVLSDGSFVTGGNPSSVTYAAGTSVAETYDYAYDPETSLVTSVTDPLTRTTAYTYDGLGNVTSITQLSGTSSSVKTSFTYNSLSRTTSLIDPLNHTSSFSYDSRGNLLNATDPLGDSKGFSYNSEGQLTSTTDGIGNTTTLGYTGPDLATITDPLGRTINFVSDGAGRILSGTDALGHVTAYSYNALNQVMSITNPLGGVTSFGYDTNGNLTSITDPRNTMNPTTFSYDNSDRLASETDALGNEDGFQYDGDNNLTQYTDRRGKIEVFTYDGLNRRTFAGFGKSGSSYESTINYSFDAGNRLTQVVDSATGTISRTYDSLNRLTNETTPQGAVNYGYDIASRRTSMTAGNQSTTAYSYDSANRLTSITQGSSAVSFAYDADNRRTSLTLPNGVVMGYSYDSASELTGMNYSLGQNPLGNLSYAYDLAGRRVAMGGTLANTGLPQPISTTAYNVANQVTQWGTATPTYDANGNTLSDGTNSYTWNARNQLVSMNAGAMTFQYDPFGRRVAKTNLTSTTNYLYDGLNPVQELSGTTPTANLLTGGLDQYFQRTDSSGTATFLTDALGSTLALTDGSGNTLAQYAYEPFGNTTITGSSTNPYQYTGRENDATGVYFYRGRYYNPLFQRFAAEDPTGAVGGINLYGYVNDAPINNVDPLGLSARGADPSGQKNEADQNNQSRPDKNNTNNNNGCQNYSASGAQQQAQEGIFNFVSAIFSLAGAPDTSGWPGVPGGPVSVPQFPPENWKQAVTDGTGTSTTINAAHEVVASGQNMFGSMADAVNNAVNCNQ